MQRLSQLQNMPTKVDGKTIINKNGILTLAKVIEEAEDEIGSLETDGSGSANVLTDADATMGTISNCKKIMIGALQIKFFTLNLTATTLGNITFPTAFSTIHLHTSSTSLGTSAQQTADPVQIPDASAASAGMTNFTTTGMKCRSASTYTNFDFSCISIGI